MSPQQAVAATASAAAAEWAARDRPRRGMAREWADVLAQLPLFAGLGSRHVRRVAALAEIVEFEPGEIIAQSGEPGDAFYVILHGRARVLGEKRGRTLGPGNFFGEMSLLDGGPRSANVTAATRLVTMKLGHRPFSKVVEREPRIALAIMRELASRVRRAESSI